MKGLRMAAAVAVVALAAGGGWWWWRSGAEEAITVDRIGDQVQTVRRGRLPDFATPPDVAALYRFATERGDLLQFMPCTCGCADLGHASNRACYIKAETPDRVTYTSHAAT